MSEYVFKFRHVVEVEIKVTGRRRKVDAEERAQEAMDIYGEDFLQDDDIEFNAVGSSVWLGGTELGTCATTTKRDGWELIT